MSSRVITHRSISVCDSVGDFELDIGYKAQQKLLEKRR
jgi:hypothetical protein